MTLRPMIVVGTRPEAIKLAPVVSALARQEGCQPLVCLTGQHRELVTPLVDYFSLPVALNLEVMRSGSGLAGLTARCLEGLDDAITSLQPDCVIAQGDTTSVLAAAMAAYYRRLPFVHVEAGLRTGDCQAPFPEEFNRRVATLATTLHCAPTQNAAQNLLAEGVAPERVRVTGNTVIDALHATRTRERQNDAHWRREYPMLGNRPLVLFTAHRRENLTGGLERACQAVARLAQQFPGTVFLCPVHPNPQVQAPVQGTLSGLANVHLRPPASYPEFVWLMDRASLILTDSGGIQEEASVLGKPVLVLRETTERVEGLPSGMVEVVGTDCQRIISRAQAWLMRIPAPGMSGAKRAFGTQAVGMAVHPAIAMGTAACRPSPYGDGQASQRIAELVMAAARCGWSTAGLKAISLAQVRQPSKVPAPHFLSLAAAKMR